MGKHFTLSLPLCMLLLATACFATSFDRFNECQLDQLNTLRPDHVVESEGGRIETWNSTHPQLRCIGVSFSRRTLHRYGLHSPSYSPYPQMIMILQGKGVLGIAIPGCAETFEEPQEPGRKPQQQQQLKDRHQNIRPFSQGDIVMIPPGTPYWTYNYGHQPLVAISLLHTSNPLNQLDQSPKEFYIGGNPDEEHPETQQKQQHHHEQHRGGRKQEQEEEENEGNSVLSGFSKEFLTQALNINEETAEQIQSPNDEKKQIGKVKGGLSIISPKWKHPKWKQEEEDEDEEPSREEQEEEEEEEEEDSPRKRQHGNSLEQTLCTIKLIENIARPSRANYYNPRAGRISTVNSHTLPSLRYLGLSAQYVVLYKKGIYSPHWNLDANSVLYVTRGRGKVRVVNCEGNAVFNGEVKKGELLVVPQNYVVASQAGEEGLEYVVFKTNHRAVTSHLKQVFRATPAEVLANAFGLRNNQVSQLKYNGNRGPLVHPQSKRP
ncbi:hypothetical protein RJT34_22560 [Clitoria ternatea]|uniref:Cupin type-1 domain-containing protein n=1 Tax=Clitoria ternatea TaxID=43366 RepID=A0AAN9FQE5_CLITE